MRKFLKRVVFLTLLLSGCGSLGIENSRIDALVSEAQATRAFALIKSLDYLPFTYIVDGCYARSYYMAMEMASEEIPSSNHFILGVLKPTEGLTWKFHVAPLLKVGDQEPWILDPSFQWEPMRRSEWIAKSNPDGIYETRITAGSVYPFHEEDRPIFDDSNMLSSFADMPPFFTRDIVQACTAMLKFLQLAPLSDSEKLEKRSKLLERTAALSLRLQSLAKLGVDLEHPGLGEADPACINVVPHEALP